MLVGMNYYDPKEFTWGYEVEWGDIPRTADIPTELGKWEYAETDIVNLREPYRYVACDPLGIDPPMGGEINMKPTRTRQEQVERIIELRDYFRSQHGAEPTASCVNHGHVHVHIPGLISDTEALKRLILYIARNQHLTIERCYQFRDSPEMRHLKNAKTYLKYDGGRPMPEYMVENILKYADSFEEFIRLHAAGKDPASSGRPFRYAINTYCLKHTTTIEFRCFRSTTSEQEIADQLRFVEMFVDSALNNGPDVQTIFMKHDFQFPPFLWNAAEYAGWIATKHDKERGTKRREYREVE